MKSLTIQGTARAELGKKRTRALRRDGQVPCVLYGEGGNIHFQAQEQDFRPAVYTPEFHKITLDIDGKTHEALIKDIQFHPVTDAIQHVDFQRLSPGKRITTEIPVHLNGLAVGVKEGGTLVLKIRRLAVRIKPEDLVEHITVNVEGLELGRSIRVSEIPADGFEILDQPGQPIATCEVPRALKSPIEEEVGEVEGEEGEEGEGDEKPEGGEGQKEEGSGES